MDFTFTADEIAFQQDVRGFIRDEWGMGDVTSGIAGESDEEFARGRDFERKLATRGWLTMAWPKEYGGQAANAIQQMIFREECAYHGAPTGGQSASMVGPAIMLHGTEEQKRRFLPPISRGEVSWCQGFSEPGAGSDLASLQTRAVADGDDYVLNGQKIWTSHARQGDWMHVLARTDPDAPKHRGITYFLLDMKTPGVSLRPIGQMHNRAGFCETFFENVRVPRENVLGEINRGWYAATTTLDFERSNIGRVAGSRRVYEEVVAFCRATPLGGRPLLARPGVRAQLAELAIEHAIGRDLAYRVGWMQSQGRVPNHEASMSKVFASELCQRLAQTALGLFGLYGGLAEGSAHAPLEARLTTFYQAAVSFTIGAGTSEIQRNIIAGRGLGLPRA